MLEQSILKFANKATPASYPSATSVLPIFGNNLRLLTSLHGTQAKVRADLDIGRIQFQRYLRGESFPKPHILKKICDYFMVDARILTEELDDDLLAEMFMTKSDGPKLAHHGAWLSAIRFAVNEQRYFDERGALEEGLYATWQRCAARKDTVLRKLFKISRKDGAMVIRGYAPRQFFPADATLKDREYRGICLNLGNKGYVFWTFFANPSQMIDMAYVRPMQISEHAHNALVGFHAITRDELPDMPRLSRIVIEKVGSAPSDLLQQAHIPSFYKLDELPPAYAALLSSPPG